MPSGAWLVVGPLVLVLFAGCGGNDEPPPPATPNEVAAPGDNPEAGTVQGLVVDDQELPLSGARVGLLDIEGVEMETGDDGAFRFTNVPPGEHRIAASKLGYVAVTQTVSLAAAGDANLELRLVAQPPAQEAYSRIVGPLYGYMQCRLGLPVITGPCGAGALWINDKSSINFTIESNLYRTIMGEMRWNPTAFSTSKELRFAFSYVGRPNTHWWCAAEGPSPTSWKLERPELDDAPQCHGSGVETGGTRDPSEPETNLTLLVYANAPFGRVSTSDPASSQPAFLTLEQRFETIVTVFYVDPAPPDYTSFV